jgi:hypothetical protein
MAKIAGSESGSISQRHGSGNPDPYQMSWIRNTAFKHKMQEPAVDTLKNHTEADSNQRDQSQTASSQLNQSFAASSQLRQTPAASSQLRQTPAASNQLRQTPTASNRKRMDPTAQNQLSHTLSTSNHQNQSPTAFNQVSQRTEAFNEECQKFLLSNCRRQEETGSTSRIQSCLADESLIQAEDLNRMPEVPSFSGDAMARRRPFLSWGRAEEEGSRETYEKDQSDSKLETTGVRGENLPKKHKGRLVQILNFTEEYLDTVSKGCDLICRCLLYLKWLLNITVHCKANSFLKFKVTFKKGL